MCGHFSINNVDIMFEFSYLKWLLSYDQFFYKNLIGKLGFFSEFICHVTSRGICYTISKRQRLISAVPLGIHTEINAPSFIIVSSETPLSKNSYDTETSQLIYKANQWTGFYTIPVFNENFFGIGFHSLFSKLTFYW